jgi:hypothetical protein
MTPRGLADKAGAGAAGCRGSGGWGSGRGRVALLGGAGEGLGHFEGVFGAGEVAVGFVGEDAEHVDGLACAEDVDLRLLAGLGPAAELQDSLHVNGLDERFEGEGGGVVRTGVGGADCEVEALGGGVEGAERLLHLLGGGAGGLVRTVFVVFFSVQLLCLGWLRFVRCIGRCGHLDDVAWEGFGCVRFGLRLVGLGTLAGLAVRGELAAVGDDEGKRLFRHEGRDSIRGLGKRTRTGTNRRGKCYGL